MIAGLLAFLALALKVSGLGQYNIGEVYRITATFENVGDLKVRAPVTIAGVHVGEVKRILLDKQTFRAKVTLRIAKTENNLPRDTSAAILTAGLLGANYISLTPGFEDAVLKEGDEITDTHQALILENLIGQFLFKMQDTK